MDNRITKCLGIAGVVTAAVLVGAALFNGGAAHKTVPNTPIVDGVHTGQFGANSRVADPRPGPALISPKLRLAAYGSATGDAVPPSEYVPASFVPPSGTTMVAPANSSALPEISQQEAVKEAAEQGFYTASNMTTQPTAYYGILSNSVLTALPTPATTNGNLPTPSQYIAEQQAGEAKLLYQNVPAWVVQFTGPAQQVTGNKRPAPGQTTTTLSANYTRPIVTVEIFINANTGAFLYGS